jgi:hypothetical protein
LLSTGPKTEPKTRRPKIQAKPAQNINGRGNLARLRRVLCLRKTSAHPAAAEDWIERIGPDGKSYRVVNHDNIRRSKLQIQARHRLISRLSPKKYGLR